MSHEGSGAAQRLFAKIDQRSATVSVVGLGYVGLPLILRFSETGFRTLGVDIDESKIKKLASGESYLKHIPGARTKALAACGRFDGSSDPAALAKADVIVLCVPTPLTPHRTPDLSYVENTARDVAKALRPGQLVVLESTSYPGTTEEVVQPILEGGGLRAGRDFFLAYSPEREDPGNATFTTQTIPKIVSGLTPACRELAERLYGSIVERVIPVSSLRVAESAKVLENIYRAVNIALVNELKVTFDRMGINVWEVIDAAKTKPFGFQAFYPGPGLGGHCIPIDPFYLTWKAREVGLSTRFIELAGEINTAMPRYVVDRLVHALNARGKPLNGSRVLVLGVAYKKDVDDVRESPAMEIIEMLQEGGAHVTYTDPHIPRLHKMRKHDLPLASVELTPAAVRAADAVLIVTDHGSFRYELLRDAPLVIDTRNAMASRGLAGPNVVQA